MVEAESLLAALTQAPLVPPAQTNSTTLRVLLPEEELPAGENRDEERIVTDVREWRSGVHAGARRVRVRTMNRSAFPPGDAP